MMKVHREPVILTFHWNTASEPPLPWGRGRVEGKMPKYGKGMNASELVDE